MKNGDKNTIIWIEKEEGDTMTLEEMRKKKRELGLSYEQIAEKSGVPLTTVQKVLGGITKSPRYDTLHALEKAFKIPEENMVRETGFDYHAEKKQGEYTVEDYLAMPEEQRAELIDGVIYSMAGPTDLHQLIAGRIWLQISNYIGKKKGECVPLFAPIDVQLNCDNRTIVQPDVIVVCDREKLRGVIYGAPDFVVEVMSPSSKVRDNKLKLHKYCAAGVREYWIVDPEKQKVIVYDFETGEWPTIYGFQSEIPINIFDGDCVVDFEEIFDYVSFLYERDRKI